MLWSGLFSGFLLARIDFRRRRVKVDASVMMVAMGIAGVLGARLYDVFLYHFWLGHEHSPQQLLQALVDPGGLTWHAGALCGLAAMYGVARRYREPFLKVADVAPAAAIGYAFGRLGCFLSGDGDYGIPSTLPWAMSFPHGLVPTTVRVHPTPLYEIATSLLIFAVLWPHWRPGARILSFAARLAARLRSYPCAELDLTHPPFPAGFICGEYLILSGLARFLVEFVRRNPRIWLGLTDAQIISIVSVALGAWLMLRKPAPAPARAFPAAKAPE
jgi:phosphatidylglycerol:prolipoprotein diacylglycerol transferase